MSLVLHTYWRSSSSYRVRIALGAKGLAYESRFVNLLEGARASSPTGYVPCLEMGGRSYIESVAIVELLDELHPEPALYPKKPEDRAAVRALVEIINAGIQPLQNLSVLGQVSADKEKRTAWMQHFMRRGLAAFESLASADGPFAAGPTFSAADVFLVPQVYASRRVGVDLSAFPRVLRAEKAALALPFVDGARPEMQGDAAPG